MCRLCSKCSVEVQMFPNVPTGVENWSEFSGSFEVWGVREIGEMTVVEWSRFTDNNFWDSNIREIGIPMCSHSRRGKVLMRLWNYDCPRTQQNSAFFRWHYMSIFIIPFVYLTYSGFTWKWILFYLNSTVFYSSKGPWQRCGKYNDKAEFIPCVVERRVEWNFNKKSYKLIILLVWAYFKESQILMSQLD